MRGYRFSYYANFLSQVLDRQTTADSSSSFLAGSDLAEKKKPEINPKFSELEKVKQQRERGEKCSCLKQLTFERWHSCDTIIEVEERERENEKHTGIWKREKRETEKIGLAEIIHSKQMIIIKCLHSTVVYSLRRVWIENLAALNLELLYIGTVGNGPISRNWLWQIETRQAL